MRNALLHKVWLTLHEPRLITLGAVIIYLLTGLIGFMLIGNASLNDALSSFVGLILLGSAALGAPCAWAGTWWLERGAALGTATGYLAAMFIVLDLHRGQTILLPVITVCLLLIGAVYGAIRFLRVNTSLYAPGKGPIDPITELRAEDEIQREISKQANDL